MTHEELVMRIEHLEERLAQKDRELEVQKELYEKKMLEKDDSIVELKLKNSRLEKVTKRITEQVGERAEWRELLNFYQDKLKMLTTEIGELEAKNQDELGNLFGKHVEEMQDELQKEKEKSKSYQQVNEDLRIKIEKLNGKLKENSSSVEDALRIQALEKSVKDWTDKSLQLEEVAEGYRKNVMELKEKYENDIEQLQKRVQETENTDDSGLYKAKYNNLASVYSQLDTEKRKLESKSNDLIRENDELVAMLTKAQHVLVEKDKYIKDMESSIQETKPFEKMEQPEREEPLMEAPIQEQPMPEQPIQEQPMPEQPIQEQPMPEQPIQEQPPGYNQEYQGNLEEELYQDNNQNYAPNNILSTQDLLQSSEMPPQPENQSGNLPYSPGHLDQNTIDELDQVIDNIINGY